MSEEQTPYTVDEKLDWQKPEVTVADRHSDEYIDAIEQQIRDCGMGVIGGQPQPYGILLRELEEKMIIDEAFGERRESVEALRLSTLADLAKAITASEAKATETDQPLTSTELAEIIEHRPEIVLLDKKARKKLFEHIEQEVDAFEPDMTTEKGRDACRALAAKITRTKTTVDKARKQLTEEARSKIAAVNAEGKIIEEALVALSKRARAPLTEYEEAEEKRIGECKAALERLRLAAIVPVDATSDSIRTRITEVEAENMAPDHWRGMAELADEARTAALNALNGALALIIEREEQAAELRRLREEAAERDRLEQERLAEEQRKREEQEARERHEVAQREQEAREAEAAAQRERDEAARAEREQAEREKVAQEAAERARAAAQREAEEAAAAEAERQRQAHEAELRAEQERREAAEREAEQARQEQAERERAARLEQEHRERLEADAKHRTQVMTDAKLAFMTVDGITEAMARSLVTMIVAKLVPRVTLDFAAAWSPLQTGDEARALAEAAKEEVLAAAEQASMDI